MCPPAHAEWVFALSWSKWSASPALSRRQFVMRAAEWGDEGGARTEQVVRGAYDGEGGSDMDQWRIGFQCFVGIYQQCVRLLCYVRPISPLSFFLFPSPLSLLLSVACLVLDGWSRQELQVGFERRGC